MNFYPLRLSLVASEPQLFVHKAISDNISIFESAIKYASQHPSIDSSGERLFSLKIEIDGEKEGVMAGFVAKAKSLNGHDANFKEFKIEDYPPMMWFWDRQQQVILVEKKTTIFQTINAASKAFERIFNNRELAEVGLIAEFEPVLQDSSNGFWHEYNSFEHLESVTFDLTPPNLFGDTEKEMKKALNQTVENTNANKVITKFENKNSQLKLKPNNWVNNLINWCRKGGGNWQMRGRLFGQSNVSVVNSEKTAKIVTMQGEITEMTLTNYSPEDIKEILELYRPEYKYED